MKRKCRYTPLSQQPLVLVLCQVRFSPVRQMERYIDAIQEGFRRNGYPLERSGKVQQLTITPAGVQALDQQKWEYISKDETWSVVVLQDSVTLQTTAYDRFERFAEQLRLAVGIVLEKTDSSLLGVVQRIGLRYIDLIKPREGEDHRFYLRSGFHGVPDKVFRSSTQRVFVECIGRTEIDGIDQSTMVVRVLQNDQGFDLPPDLLGGAPKRPPRAKQNELATLVDMDHFIEGSFDPSEDWIVESAYKLHDHLIETFHESVVTPEAIGVWR